jgi:hypothetical protein
MGVLFLRWFSGGGGDGAVRRVGASGSGFGWPQHLSKALRRQKRIPRTLAASIILRSLLISRYCCGLRTSLIRLISSASAVVRGRGKKGLHLLVRQATGQTR